VPEEVLRSAPAEPWGFSVPVFTAAASAELEEPSETPSRRVELEALGSGGSVLDVGAGAGRASLPLVPPATLVIAVDESEQLLAELAELARGRGVPHALRHGRWPDVADQVPTADLVVCHHVVYNVADIVPFLFELDRHARRRVVLEVTEAHPASILNDAWMSIHGIRRPDRPVVADLLAVLQSMGIEASSEDFESPPRPVDAERVAMARRQLCVGPERDEEIAELLPRSPRRMVTIWWEHPRG
jgi:SAM-dependent methyltransferase